LLKEAVDNRTGTHGRGDEQQKHGGIRKSYAAAEQTGGKRVGRRH
jgi:hypothetical protein